jgi:hypothetical protein
MIQIITNFLKRISGNYGNELESYITARNPKNEGDIERLTREYHNRLVQHRYY